MSRIPVLLCSLESFPNTGGEERTRLGSFPALSLGWLQNRLTLPRLAAFSFNIFLRNVQTSPKETSQRALMANH